MTEVIASRDVGKRVGISFHFVTSIENINPPRPYGDIWHLGDIAHDFGTDITSCHQLRTVKLSTPGAKLVKSTFRATLFFERVPHFLTDCEILLQLNRQVIAFLSKTNVIHNSFTNQITYTNTKKRKPKKCPKGALTLQVSFRHLLDAFVISVPFEISPKTSN